MHSPLRLPRVLITNDDGFDAPGIQVLAEIAADFAHEVWVVAPEQDQSGSGQSLSLHHPLRCRPRGERKWEVTGTPADCVAIALSHLMAKSKPTLVLSGVNAGSNTGDDINLSGTVGAAFTALLLGVPSIAFSLDFSTRAAARWDTARAMLPKILTHFLAEGWRKETCLSVNIPDRPAEEIRGFSWARQSPKTIDRVQIDRRVDMREQDYFWLSLHDREETPRENSDLAILRRGEISVTALALDRSVDAGAASVVFGEPAYAADE